MAFLVGDGDMSAGGGALHHESSLGKAAMQVWPTAILVNNTRIVIPQALC